MLHFRSKWIDRYGFDSHLQTTFFVQLRAVKTEENCRVKETTKKLWLFVFVPTCTDTDIISKMFVCDRIHICCVLFTSWQINYILGIHNRICRMVVLQAVMQCLPIRNFSNRNARLKNLYGVSYRILFKLGQNLPMTHWVSCHNKCKLEHSCAVVENWFSGSRNCSENRR